MSSERKRISWGRILVLALFWGTPVLGDTPQALHFNRDIRPILAENCFQCHGPDKHKRKANLRLDSEEGAFAAREDGPAIVRGEPAKSEMYRRITAADPKKHMP